MRLTEKQVMFSDESHFELRSIAGDLQGRWIEGIIHGRTEEAQS
jgi:hypothetical protein